MQRSKTVVLIATLAVIGMAMSTDIRAERSDEDLAAAVAAALQAEAVVDHPPSTVDDGDPSTWDQVPAEDMPPPTPEGGEPTEIDDPGKGVFDTPSSVIEYVLRQLPGVTWEWSTTGVNVVVVRKQGSSYDPGGGGEASYDDLILAVSRDRVWAYGRGNAEGTENDARRRSYGYVNASDPYLGRPVTPALAPGAYRIKVDYHLGQYRALFVYGWDYAREGLKSQRFNGKYAKWQVGGVNLHYGGDAWNYSVGCLTLHYSQWDSFIAKFPTEGAWGRLYLVGDCRSGYRDYNLRVLSLASGGLYDGASGPRFRVAAKIRNEATVALGPFSVSLWINDGVVRRALSSLARLSDLTVTFDTDIPLAEQGIYPSSVLVDSRAQVNEFDEDDNKLQSVDLHLVRGRNLVARGVADAHQDEPGGGQVVQVTVANDGGEPVEQEFAVTLYVNGGTFPMRLAGLGAGETKSVPVMTNITTADAYDWALLVDSNAEVTEDDEEDNKLQGTLVVPSPDFDGELTIACGGDVCAVHQAVVGQPLTFSGTATGGIGWLEVFVDGWPLKKMEPDDGEYRFVYTFSSSGTGRRLLMTAYDRTGEGRRFLTGVATTIDVRE